MPLPDLWILLLARTPAKLSWTRQVCLNLIELLWKMPRHKASMQRFNCEGSGMQPIGTLCEHQGSEKPARPALRGIYRSNGRCLQQRESERNNWKPPESLNDASKYSHPVDEIHLEARRCAKYSCKVLERFWGAAFARRCGASWSLATGRVRETARRHL